MSGSRQSDRQTPVWRGRDAARMSGFGRVNGFRSVNGTRSPPYKTEVLDELPSGAGLAAPRFSSRRSGRVAGMALGPSVDFDSRRALILGHVRVTLFPRAPATKPAVTSALSAPKTTIGGNQAKAAESVASGTLTLRRITEPAYRPRELSFAVGVATPHILPAVAALPRMFVILQSG
jgi:hypothetical protein